jgi:hypothetical protein
MSSEEESAAIPQDEGLYGKYDVYKDGEPQDGCFVLKPESDPAALEALKEYATETDDHFLGAELCYWIADIQRAKAGDDSE